MPQPPRHLAPIDTTTIDLTRPDTATLDDAYRDDVYDPRRDVRNQYPMIAQRMLLDPEIRKGLEESAKDICASGMYGYKRSESDLAAVRTVAIKGFAMGLDFARALETIKVIHGTPTIRGPQALHLIRERTRGATLDCVESSRDRAVWKLGRPGNPPKTFRATREQIERAKLDKRNDLWNIYPERMLKWHAFSEGAQELFGDVLMGCYITEEMGMHVQFERDIDEAARQTSEHPRRRAEARDARSEMKEEKQQKRRRNDAAAQSTASDSNSTRAVAEPGAEKATPEMFRKLSLMLTDLAKARGAIQPTDEMGPDQAALVEKNWNLMRSQIWEEVASAALDGEVPTKESLTKHQARMIRDGLLLRINEAGEP